MARDEVTTKWPLFLALLGGMLAAGGGPAQGDEPRLPADAGQTLEALTGGDPLAPPEGAAGEPVEEAVKAVSPAPWQVTVRKDARLRAGAGTRFGVVGRVKVGDKLTVQGRDANGEWLQLAGGEWLLAALTDADAAAERTAAGTGGAGGLPFAEVARLALTNNPQYVAAKGKLEAAREVERQGLANLLPQVSASAGLSGKKNEWSGGENSSDPKNAKLQVNQILFDVPALVTWRQGQPYQQAAEQDLEAMRQAVLLQAAQVTLAILQADEVARLADNNLVVTQRNLEATEARFRVGEITRTDVSRAIARMELARASLLNARNQGSVSRAQYKEVVGEAPPPRLGLPEVPEALIRQALTEITREAAKSAAAPLPERPDVVAARTRLRQAEMDVDKANAGHLPTVNLTAYASTTRGGEIPTMPEPVEEYLVGVTLTQPIFAGGGTVSKTRQAKAQRDVQESDLNRVRNLAQREAEQAMLDMRSAQATLVAYQSAEDAANDALRGSEQEYNVGTRTMLDLLDAQYQLFSAQTDRAKSRYAVLLARFKLLQATGLLTPDVIGVK